MCCSAPAVGHRHCRTAVVCNYFMWVAVLQLSVQVPLHHLTVSGWIHIWEKCPSGAERHLQMSWFRNIGVVCYKGYGPLRWTDEAVTPHRVTFYVLFICFRLFVSMSTTVSVWRVFVQDIVNIFLFLRVWKSLLVMRGKQTRLLAFHLTVVWVELTPTQHVNQFPTSCSTDLLLPSSSVCIHRNQTCKKTSVSVSELGIDGESCGVTPYFLFEHQIK